MSLVERLRDLALDYPDRPYLREAADEIERLRRDCAVDVSELYREIERLRGALRDIHEHAIMGHDDAADGFIKIAGMVRDALNVMGKRDD
jgi:hypothetical protein